MKFTKTLMLLGIVSTLFIGSCQYKFNDAELGGAPTFDNSITYSFQDTILPIFNDNDNCSGCHKAGSIGGSAIILTPDVCYTQLMSKPGMVDTVNADQSKIYLYPKIGTSTHQNKKYTKVQADLIYAWIKQGAKNN